MYIYTRIVVPSPFFRPSFSGPPIVPSPSPPFSPGLPSQTPDLLLPLSPSSSSSCRRSFCHTTVPSARANRYPRASSSLLLLLLLLLCTRKHLVAVDLERANPSTAKQPIISLQRYTLRLAAGRRVARARALNVGTCSREVSDETESGETPSADHTPLLYCSLVGVSFKSTFLSGDLWRFARTENILLGKEAIARKSK